jgi:hypothetical protein
MDYESAVEIREAIREQTDVLRELRDAVLTLAAAVAAPRCERPSEAVDCVRWLDAMLHERRKGSHEVPDAGVASSRAGGSTGSVHERPQNLALVWAGRRRHVQPSLSP